MRSYAKWETYRTFFRSERQRTGGRVSWTSECVFVPRAVVMDDMARWSSGRYKPAA